MRILVHDDEGIILDLIDERLRRKGYSCLLANTFKQVIEFINAQNDLALLITDCNFPNGTVDQVIDAFRKNFPQGKIIAISSSEESLCMIEPKVDSIWLKSPDWDPFIQLVKQLTASGRP